MNVILTGATGMVGEGVLLECLQNSSVSEILIINRKSYNLMHPKVGKAMINVVKNGCPKQNLEVTDIKKLAK